jgi:hypothetical protein
VTVPEWLRRAGWTALIVANLALAGWFVSDKIDGYVQRRAREAVAAYHSQVIQPLIQPPSRAAQAPAAPPGK